MKDKGIIKRQHTDRCVWDHNTTRCIPDIAPTDECFHRPSYCDSALWPKEPGCPRRSIDRDLPTQLSFFLFISLSSVIWWHIFHLNGTIGENLWHFKLLILHYDNSYKFMPSDGYFAHLQRRAEWCHFHSTNVLKSHYLTAYYSALSLHTYVADTFGYSYCHILTKGSNSWKCHFSQMSKMCLSCTLTSMQLSLYLDLNIFQQDE